MSNIFLTGFPGFLGTALIPKILKRSAKSTKLYCLVQSKFAELAEKRRQELLETNSLPPSKIVLVEGDLTDKNLGLESPESWMKQVTEIYHIAAAYDMSVPRATGLRVNLDGTRNLLRFSENCPKLKRLFYVSTCYVSGRYKGAFRECDLDVGQKFNNHYEETKFLAEVDIDIARKNGLPVTVYRPSIVVGDSKTGVTQKFDGPYYAFRWISRQSSVAIIPVSGNPHRIKVNIVPSDFVIDSIDYLSSMKKSLGKTYQLCDHRPPSVQGFLDAVAAVSHKKILEVPLPGAIAKFALNHIPGVYDLMQIPAESVNYFNHPTTYTCENTIQDLMGTGIYCPPFESYMPVIYNFMLANSTISSAAMV